nr:MAG TPA: hypothetical protein [Caudoviricetes sp.]
MPSWETLAAKRIRPLRFNCKKSVLFTKSS